MSKRAFLRQWLELEASRWDTSPWMVLAVIVIAVSLSVISGGSPWVVSPMSAIVSFSITCLLFEEVSRKKAKEMLRHLDDE